VDEMKSMVQKETRKETRNEKSNATRDLICSSSEEEGDEGGVWAAEKNK
jgi:hypothetical protein